MYLPEGIQHKIWKIQDKVESIQYKIWRITHPKQAREYDEQLKDFFERWFGND